MEKLTYEQLKTWRDIAVIDGANSVIELIDNLSEARRELATLKESTRWVPMGEGNVPRGVMLEVCNAKTQTANLCMYGSIMWVTIQPTHYRKPLSLPPVEEGK